MSNVPAELKYTSSHEWVAEEEGGTYRVGITEHAQALLGDMVFIDLPDAGSQFNAGDECAVAESVKAASDVYTPLSGEVVEVNGELEGAPEQVNSDPYGSGWLFRIKPADGAEWDNLLDAAAYQTLLDEEDDGH